MGTTMTTPAVAKAALMGPLMIRMADVTMMATTIPPTGVTMTIMVLPMIPMAPLIPTHMGLPIVVTLIRMGHPTMAPLIPTRMGCPTRGMTPTTKATTITMAQPTTTRTAHLIPLVPTS